MKKIIGIGKGGEKEMVEAYYLLLKVYEKGEYLYEDEEIFETLKEAEKEMERAMGIGSMVYVAVIEHTRNWIGYRHRYERKGDRWEIVEPNLEHQVDALREAG